MLALVRVSMQVVLVQLNAKGLPEDTLEAGITFSGKEWRERDPRERLTEEVTKLERTRNGDSA